MFFIAYTLKGQVHMFAGQVNIVSHSSCRTSAILKYFCPLHGMNTSNESLSICFDCHKGKKKVADFLISPNTIKQ